MNLIIISLLSIFACGFVYRIRKEHALFFLILIIFLHMVSSYIGFSTVVEDTLALITEFWILSFSIFNIFFTNKYAAGFLTKDLHLKIFIILSYRFTIII